MNWCSPSLLGTEASRGGLDCFSFFSESSPDFQGSQPPTHTPLPPGSRSPASHLPAPFLPTAVLKPQESLAQLLPTPDVLKSEGEYPAAVGGWPRARRREVSGECPLATSQAPNPISAPKFCSVLSWGSLWSTSHPTKPPAGSELAPPHRWIRRSQKKCMWKFLPGGVLLGTWKTLKFS